MRLTLKLRIFFFYFYWAFCVALFFFLMLPAMLLPVACRGRIMSACASLVYLGMRIILGLRCQIIGRENIPKTSCLILSKHQSAWETIAFNWLFFPPCFVLKKELIKIPVFGWGLAMAGSIAIDRGGGSKSIKKVITKGKERLKQGFNVIVFPEGTRVPPGKTKPFQKGGALLAAEMNVPIIPVAHNAGELLPKGLQLKKTGTVIVSIGPAIDPTGKKASEINTETENWIATEMQKITDPAYFEQSAE